MAEAQQRTALVTGASGGIGKEIARQLLGEGLTVHVAGRDAGKVAAAVEELGGDARPLLLDVADAASIGEAASGVAQLDVLVNNAGIGDDAASAVDASVDDFRRIYETNVFGVVAVTQAFLPALRRSAHPRIVNVSSGTGSLHDSLTSSAFAVSRGGSAAYRSSKTALNAVTVFTAQALEADGVKVNALAPGLRRTNLNARAASADGDPAEAAAGAVRLALLPDDGPTAGFFDWSGRTVAW